MATFREDDVMAGRPTSDDVLLRQLVSKGSGGVVRPKRATPAATRKGPSGGTAPAVQTSAGGAYRVRRKSHTLARTAPFLSLP